MHSAVEKYISSEDPQEALIMDDRLKINECFYYFKTLVKRGGKPMLQSKMMENKMMNKENGSGGEVS